MIPGVPDKVQDISEVFSF